jgi:hypothetical protein
MAVTAVTTFETVYSDTQLSDGNATVGQTNTNTNGPAFGAAYQALASGANTITVPTGFTVNGVTIIPGSSNTTSITFKAVTGDVGVRIHNTCPSQIALDSSVVNFCLTAGGAITVKLAWW